MTEVTTVRASAVAVALATHGICTVPLILMGTLAVRLRADLDFGTAGQGLLAAGLVLLAAGSTTVAGSIVDGAWGRWALSAAAALTAFGLAGGAMVSTSMSTLAPFMAVAGIALGVAQPASDAYLHRVVPRSQQGRIFSLKQAIAGPGIGLVAGFAVPASSVVGGWRGAFAAGAAVAAAIAVVAARTGRSAMRSVRPSRRPGPTQVLDGALPSRPLLWLAIAGGVATVPQAAFLAFAVSAATDAGLSESTAGVLFALSCVLAVAARLLLGRRIDRRQGSILGLVMGLLLASVVGFLCFSIDWQPAVIIGMPLIAATAWGWHGLFFLVAVRTSPGAPGRASGLAGAGVLVGAVTGPLLFGVGAEWSYTASWALAAAWSLVGVGCVAGARRSIIRAMGRPDLTARLSGTER